MDEQSFTSELAKLIQESLQAGLDVWWDVRAQEPSLVGIVSLVNGHPHMLPVADEALARLVPRLAQEDPHFLGVTEMLGYCVHTLKLPGVLEATESLRQVADNKWRKGTSGRAWDHLRRCERVIAAAVPDWSERGSFQSLL